MTVFPDAEYVILSSRLIPDRDGGYTLATLARARQMAAAGVHGGRGPLLLTVDPGTPEEHAHHRAVFDGRDLIVGVDRMRNLFDEASGADGGAAAWLLDAVHPGDPDPALEYRPVPAGRPVLSLPVIPDDPDWHITSAPIAVHGADGRVRGILSGFGALYRAWLEHVTAELRADDPTRPVIVVCESRQLGELLAGWDDPDVRLLHSIHTVHMEPPYTLDAETNALWERWFSVAERFDAVLWPTAAQRDAIQERFGASDVHIVVPNGVPAASAVAPLAGRDPHQVVMLNRLAFQKRVDHAVRAFAGVIKVLPEARLDIFGDGPLRAEVQALVDELGVGSHVVLRGPTDDPGRVLDEAAVFLSTSRHEGQGLSLAEALVRGCPVVAYDAPFGPAEALAGGGGLLVPNGDIEAMTQALVRVLTDLDLRHRLSVEAVEAARRIEPEHVMSALAGAVRDVLAKPSRRSAVS